MSSILALTFTNAGAANMRKRLVEIIGSAFTSAMIITAGSIVSTIGLVKLSQGRNTNYLYNAIDIFNSTLTSTYTNPPPKVKIDLGYVGGNVGLFVTF